MKIHKKRKTPKTVGLEVNTDATRILRTVSDHEAFYFYEDIGKPTGESVKSLLDFLKKVDFIKLESLLFHLQRKDFQSWIKKTLGDSKLARRIGRIPLSNNENTRTKIHATIENRIKELRESSITLSVSEHLTITSPSSNS